MFRETAETPTLDLWMSSKTQSSPKTSDVWRIFSKRRPLANKIIIIIKKRKLFKNVITCSPKTWGLQRGRMSKQRPAVKQHRGGWRRGRRAAERTRREEERGAYLAEELRLLSWGLLNFCWSTFCSAHGNEEETERSTDSLVSFLHSYVTLNFEQGKKSVHASRKTRASPKSLERHRLFQLNTSAFHHIIISWILFFRWQRKTINNGALVACHRRFRHSDRKWANYCSRVKDPPDSLYSKLNLDMIWVEKHRFEERESQ